MHQTMHQLNSLMTLTKGTSVVCTCNPIEKDGIELNTPYRFVCYDDSNVPVNNYQACMNWYPNKPIWTPEEYEEISFKFMRIKLEGIENPQWLKDYKIYEFTD